MKKINYIKILKIALGSALAMIIAKELGLKNVTSAGIITLLSILDTKRETLNVAIRRLCAFIVAFVISYFSFSLLGYTAFAFGIYLLFFLVTASIFKLQDGIAMCSVLMTHFLIDQNMGFDLLRNEAYIMLIGVGLGVLLNLYMPSNTKSIRLDQYKIEEDIKTILKRMSTFLLKESKEGYLDSCFSPLETHIEDALTRSYENMNNSFVVETLYFIHYMQMRQNQLSVLKSIYNNIIKVNEVPSQTHVIANFIELCSASFHEYNNAIELLDSLYNIRESFKNDPLPITRNEFESRAILYQILSDLETFLVIKRDFVLSLTDKQVKTYWDIG